MAKKQPSTKTSSITLRSNGAVLMLLATAQPDGRVVTTVNTKAAGDKRFTRGMTESHATMDKAKARLASLAADAQKAGWVRGKFEVARKPDAFTALPAAPTAVA